MICDYNWAIFHLDQERKVRRKGWPIGWRIWKNLSSAGNYPLCGWGNQIGLTDSEAIKELGTDGHYWTPTEKDKTATDWELL